MGRKRRKKRARASRLTRLIRAGALLALALYLAAPAIERALRRADRAHLPLIALTLATALLARRGRRAWLRRRRVRELAVSDHARDYLIDDHDFSRNGPKEAAYRRAMQLSLLATFDNRCAKCGRRDDGVDLDHFFLPKVSGGCFIMRHRDGFLVNNAIPLCVRCNRSKAARRYQSFFTPAELIPILEKNQKLTELLNARAPLTAGGAVKPRRRSDRAA